MDYCQLLYKAQENKRNASHKEVRCYTTSFTAPKKLERSKVSSENIKKFLARKEEEEKRKLLEAKKKKDELLALRSQDKKAQKRVQVMLKRTKSANKSVMADAIDNVNTADTLAGPQQCDEDDYGYVSQEASAYYNKLMDKYQNMPPEKSLFSKSKSEVKDLNAAKDRVKAALLKEAEDELAPHKRKRKKREPGDPSDENEKSSSGFKSDDESTPEEESKPVQKEEKPKKPKRPMPPPVDFEQLLKIAEKKQFEPIMIEKVEVPKEPERLMTKKEKLEYMREKERRTQKESGVQGKTTNENKKPTGNDQTSKKSNSDPKKKDASDGLSNTTPSNAPSGKSRVNEVSAGKNSLKTEKPKEKSTSESSVEERLQKSSQVWSKPCNLPPKGDLGTAKKSTNNRPVPSQHSQTTVEKKSRPETKIKEQDRKVQPSKKPNSTPPNEDELSEIDREIELLRRKRELLANRNSQKIPEVKPPPAPAPAPAPTPSQVTTSNQMKPKASPVKPTQERRPPPKPLSRPKQFPPPDLKKVRKKRRRLDSDSEYDSELDDFIDDDVPEQEMDYSKQIQEIFRYDKSRYRDFDDDDDECMESNFAQQMKEEYISTKIGILEDLEDIRKEQEEKARKKMKKVKR